MKKILSVIRYAAWDSQWDFTKRLLIIAAMVWACVGIAWIQAHAADTAVPDMTEDTAPTGDDWIYTVNDPAGTPADRKTSITSLFKTQRSSEAVQVSGVTRAIKYYDGAGNVVGIDIFHDANVTDYGAGATVGSIAWAIATLTAHGEIRLSQGNFNIDTGLSLDAKEGISIIGSGVKYYATQISTNDAITMLSMNESQYCKIMGIYFNGAGAAAKGIYCYDSVNAQGNFENVFEDVMIDNCTIGMQMGTTDNYQASENALRNVIFTSNTTGFYLRGQNTLNITLYSCKFNLNATAIDSAGGNFIAFSPLFVGNTTRDILIDAGLRQNMIVGGQTEQGERALEIGSTGSNLGYTFIGFSFIADTSTADATFITDSSLMPASFIDCRFYYGAGATFAGFTPVPASELVTNKIFNNCVWRDGSQNVVAPIIAGDRTNITVIHFPLLHPATAETISAGGTITANACGGVKLITSAGDVTTDTTNTFTAPALGNNGCAMDIVNTGANTITLDSNANFVSAGGANVALGSGDSVRVVSTGASGKWYQIGATGNN